MSYKKPLRGIVGIMIAIYLTYVLVMALTSSFLVDHLDKTVVKIKQQIERK